jgi:hypothetical protein
VKLEEVAAEAAEAQEVGLGSLLRLTGAEMTLSWLRMVPSSAGVSSSSSALWGERWDGGLSG